MSRSAICFAFATLALFSFSSAVADVVVLTEENFEKEVGQDLGALVEFYAPWEQEAELQFYETKELGEEGLGFFFSNLRDSIANCDIDKMSSVSGSGGDDRDRNLKKRHVVEDDLDAYNCRLMGRSNPACVRARVTIMQPETPVDLAPQQSPVDIAHEQSSLDLAPPTTGYDAQSGPSPIADNILEAETRLQQTRPIFHSRHSSISEMAGSSKSYGKGRGRGLTTAGFQPLQHSYKREEKEDVSRNSGHQGGPPQGEGAGPAHRRGRGEGGDACWRLTHSLRGGPTIPDPLSGFLGHIAHAIWNREERDVLTCHSGADRVASWSILSPPTLDLIASSTLSHLKDCMFSHLNMPLISAFVERWHPETNSFHMPFGEMTITLHDVWYILRIPITGNPIISQTGVAGIKGQLAALLGISISDVNAEWKSSTVKFRTVQDRLSPSDVRPSARATGYLLWLLGATLFLDKSSTRLSVHYLPFLQTLEDVPNYAWGTATLACLYRQLGIASRADTHQIAGCLTLLEAWIYEYFPDFRPGRRAGWTSDLPCSLKWATTSTPRASQAALLDYRRRLDQITVDLVNWTPFGKNPKREVPISLFSGIIHCRSITEPYMPDRCLRQFGYVQTIPTEVYIPRKVYRGRKTLKYICEHDVMLRTWQTWQTCVLKLGDIGSSRARFPNEDVEGYLAWFRERSHPRVSPLQGDDDDDDDDENGDVPPQQMSDSARLQYVAARARFLHPSRRHRTDQETFWEMLDEICIHLHDLM